MQSPEGVLESRRRLVVDGVSSSAMWMYTSSNEAAWRLLAEELGTETSVVAIGTDDVRLRERDWLAECWYCETGVIGCGFSRVSRTVCTPGGAIPSGF